MPEQPFSVKSLAEFTRKGYAASVRQQSCQRLRRPPAGAEGVRPFLTAVNAARTGSVFSGKVPVCLPSFPDGIFFGHLVK